MQDDPLCFQTAQQLSHPAGFTHKHVLLFLLSLLRDVSSLFAAGTSPTDSMEQSQRELGGDEDIWVSVAHMGVRVGGAVLITSDQLLSWKTKTVIVGAVIMLQNGEGPTVYLVQIIARGHKCWMSGEIHQKMFSRSSP